NNHADSAYGGGIYNKSGTVTLTNVTLSGNSASSAGGIYNESGTATLTNVTLTGNHADSGGGGGIYNESGTATLSNVTLSGNSASQYGGAIYEKGNAGQTITLKNTIVANSTTGGNCYRDPAFSANIGTSGFNLSDDDSCTLYLSPLVNDQNNTPAG